MQRKYQHELENLMPLCTRTNGRYSVHGVMERISVQQLVDFFIYLRRDKLLNIPVVEYQSALSRVFSLSGIDLSNAEEMLMLIEIFEKSCLPRELQPRALTVALVLAGTLPRRGAKSGVIISLGRQRYTFL